MPLSASLFNKIEDLMLQGITYMNNDNLVKASKVFNQIIHYGHSPYLSGAYVNLAQATLNINVKDQARLKDALRYLDTAIQVKPENQTARVIAAGYSLLQKDVHAAIDYFSKVTDKSVILQEIQMVQAVYDAINNVSLANPLDLVQKITELEEIFQNNKNIPHFGTILMRVYIVNKDYQKSYRLMDELENIFVQKPETYIALCTNFSMEVASSNPKEGIGFALKGLDSFNKQSSSYKRMNQMQLDFLKTNLGMNYLLNNQLTEAIEILSVTVKNNPNNTDFQNLAVAYYKLGDYEKALKYINSALFIMKDDAGWKVKGDILYQLKQYSEALKYYLKAASFIESADTSVRYKEDIYGDMKSFNSKLKGTRKEIYIGLANCYIGVGEYELAKAAAGDLKKEWYSDDEVRRLNQNIDLFLLHKSNEKEIEENIKDLKAVLNQMKEDHKKTVFEVKEWALQIIKLQNKYADKNDEKLESDWPVLMQKMHNIALQMKKNIKKDVQYNQIKQSFVNRFPNISNNGLEFLATGEYLYTIHSNDEIDFAPIMVEFSKVIETELNLMIVRKGIKRKSNLTLGQMKFLFIKNNPMDHHKSFTDFMDELIIHRNRSAHTGKSTKSSVERVRDLILEEGWLENVINNK